VFQVDPPNMPAGCYYLPPQAQVSLAELFATYISEPLFVHFISAMLTLDPSKRPMPSELLGHEWLEHTAPPVASIGGIERVDSFTAAVLDNASGGNLLSNVSVSAHASVSAHEVTDQSPTSHRNSPLMPSRSSSPASSTSASFKGIRSVVDRVGSRSSGKACECSRSDGHAARSSMPDSKATSNSTSWAVAGVARAPLVPTRGPGLPESFRSQIQQQARNEAIATGQVYDWPSRFTRF